MRLKTILIPAGIVLLIAIVLGGGRTNYDMVFPYPVAVRSPQGVHMDSVAYRCFWQRAVAEMVAEDVASFGSAFEAVGASRFDASVKGYRVTRWWGLIERRGRESSIVVRAKSRSGKAYVGMADLPDAASPVVVMLHRAN